MKKLWILPLAAVMMVACGETKEEEKTDGEGTEAPAAAEEEAPAEEPAAE